jgi:DNA (cytosine-5)-methyltransferase 1
MASFFAGIGGFDLGFERAGLKTVWQCENHPFCEDILEQHWKQIPRFRDIREVPANDIPAADVWTGGFPCQDVSLARQTKRPGLKGRQSGLFYKYAELIGARRPSVVLIENVPGLLSSHGGRDFEVVIRTLADLGYGVAWRVLNSRYFGVPQSRQRVYIVACYRDPGRAGEILFEPECSERHHPENRSDGPKAVSPFKSSFGDLSRGPVVPGIAYCLYACSARHTGTDWSRNYVSYPDGRVRRLLPIECERIQGFPEGWTVPQKWTGDTEKVDSARYHALGNAVTVRVAQWLGWRVADTHAAAGSLEATGDHESGALVSAGTSS